jgi:hypothetical protein
MSTHTIDFANGESFNLEFDSDAHQYRLVESGEVVPSATQILSIIAKPALIYWAAYEGGKYFKKQVVELVNNEVSTPTYSLGGLTVDEVVKGITSAHSKVSGDAVDIGTTVHNYIERCIKFKLKEQDNPDGFPDEPENKQAQNSIAAFRKWYSTNNVKFLSSEEKVYHPELKYAGTVDAVAEVNDEFCVIDFKTSSKVYPEHHIQCAAYAKAVELIYDREVECTYVLRFDKKTGKCQVSRSEQMGEDFVAFRAAMALTRRLKGGNRGKGKRKSHG